MLFIALLALGLLAGIIAGLLGVGGGIIFTPVLYFLFVESGVENPIQWTIGSGLLCSGIAAVGSTVRQQIQNNVFLKESLMVGILGSTGIFLGKVIVTSSFFGRTQFVIFFSILLLFTSLMMFKRGQDKKNEYAREFKPLNTFRSFFVGGIGGLIASLAGVGGGAVMVPLMNLVLKQPFKKTVSISSFSIVLITFSGTLQFALIAAESAGASGFSAGYVDFGASLPLIVGGVLGGFAGAYLNHKISRRILQWSFAALALFMASRLIWSLM